MSDAQTHDQLVSRAGDVWLDLERLAQVEITSESAEHPIESALIPDDAFERIGGQKDKLIGLLQERYGYSREQAEQEVERRLQEYGDKTGGAVASMSARAREFGATAAKKANEAAPVIGDEIAGERDP